MPTRNYLYTILLTALGVLAIFLNGFGLMAQIQFQLIIAICLFLNLRSNWSIVYIVLYLFISDAALSVNPSYSLISFCIPALLLSFTSNLTPLTKQAPFWLARVFWLIISLAIYLGLNGQLGVPSSFNLIGIFLLNLLVLIVITLLVRTDYTSGKTQDIVI